MSEPKADLSTTQELAEAVPTEHVVDFATDDPADPLNWPSWRKWAIALVMSLLSAFVQLSIVMVAPLAPQIQASFHSPSPTSAALLVTIWELGEVFGPLLYGPLSERVGRLPVIHAANAALLLFAIGCACAPSMPALLALRFLSGTSVAVVSLSGAVVADMFAPAQRGPAMAFMMVGSRTGPALGPILGSLLGERKGWRAAFWLSCGLAGAGSAVLLALYRETYRVKILQRKVARLQRATGNKALRSRYSSDGERAEGWRRFARAVGRPLYLITHSWILAGLTAYVSVFLGLFYLSLTTIAEAFLRTYAFSEGQTGLAYLGLYVGMIIGSIYFTIVSKVQVRRLAKAENPVESKDITPEHRLVPGTIAGALLSAGFFAFGWTLQYRVHWMAPIVATALIGFGYFIITVSVRSYIVDAFGIYGASASAAMLSFRNVVAALLPLAGPALYARLGYGWGSSLLGFIGLTLTPLPLIFIKYGHRIRQASSSLTQP